MKQEDKSPRRLNKKPESGIWCDYCWTCQPYCASSSQAQKRHLHLNCMVLLISFYATIKVRTCVLTIRKYSYMFLLCIVKLQSTNRHILVDNCSNTTSYINILQFSESDWNQSYVLMQFAWQQKNLRQWWLPYVIHVTGNGQCAHSLFLLVKQPMILVYHQGDGG